jgi:multidrug efflux pump subunit AcrB
MTFAGMMLAGIGLQRISLGALIIAWVCWWMTP